MGLKPVASRRPTPFHPPVRELRRPIRNLITADTRPIPPPLLTYSAGADDLGAQVEAAPWTADLDAPPARVLVGREEPMQFRVSSHGGAILAVDETSPPRTAVADELLELPPSPIGIGDEAKPAAEPDTAADGVTRPMRDTAGHMGDQAACLEPARNSGPRMEGSVAAARKLPTAPADFIPAPATNTPMASEFCARRRCFAMMSRGM
ncbi:UNVERIFIED_CONTAM: hypothetical protein Sradi_7077400 [Sesamum radiatum]|uniref:Uncharacterized protein n=1 Tax=Sesamum radiatum TaxID=300843 RepID=A0AAW2J3M5_SESRA